MEDPAEKKPKLKEEKKKKQSPKKNADDAIDDLRDARMKSMLLLLTGILLATVATMVNTLLCRLAELARTRLTALRLPGATPSVIGRMHASCGPVRRGYQGPTRRFTKTATRVKAVYRRLLSPIVYDNKVIWRFTSRWRAHTTSRYR